LEYFEAAAALEKNNFYVLYGLADCQRGLSRHERSLEAWEALLTISPGNRIILTRAGDACRIIGELERAETLYKEALAVDFDLYAEIGMASVMMIRGELDQAIGRLLPLLEKEPLNPRVAQELADCYRAADDPDSAERLISDFVERGGKLREQAAG
jgi:tetratricopeptide (TPR) repeat protein